MYLLCVQNNILECRIHSKDNINAYGCTNLIEQIGNNSRNVHSAKWWIIIDLSFRLRDILAKADKSTTNSTSLFLGNFSLKYDTQKSTLPTYNNDLFMT